MKAKIFTLIILGIMLVSVSGSYSQNILTDGDFSSTTEITPYTGGVGPAKLWCSFQNAGTEANAAIVSGVCNYQVVNAGFDTWEVQLIQWGFSLTPGHYYRLSFDVMADNDRWFGVYLGEEGGSWTSILGYENYWQYATTGWQTKTIDFNASVVFPYHKFSLEIGGFNTVMYFDNIMLTDLGLNPSVGIIGTAVNGWDVDVDMATSDGITYTLNNYPLTLGALKFRQSNNWSINWGSTDFPTGIGFQDGPNIPVISASNYDITFNRITGEYSFVCSDNCHAAIGILGTAVPPENNWETHVNMMTIDGITYMLNCYTFTDGEAKFRKDDSGDYTWGGASFPSGVATAGGQAIPVIAGNYNVIFNINTGEYSFSYPRIGILGSSLTGWMEDIDMQSTDGINYTLSDYTFASGEVKFRQDDDWMINWGSWTFPAGYGWQDGPNIPVPEGTYTVTFNRLTGEYGFTATSCPVAGIQCPDMMYVPSDSGICGAIVYYPDVIPASNCGGKDISITQIEGLPSGALFPVGVTTNTFMLINAEGNTAYCSFDVYVWDSQAPVMLSLRESYEPLWPANHRMVEVPIDYSVYDNCGNASCEIYVWSNEPDDGTGDGDMYPDWEILDNHTVLLRAERSGTETGREYHVVISCHDDSWNYSWNEVVIKVPHDMGNKSPFMISLWPNPSEYNFNLQVGSETDTPIQVSVSDAMGRQLLKFQTRDNQIMTFGNSLNPGTYFVKVSQGTYTETIMILKQ